MSNTGGPGEINDEPVSFIQLIESLACRGIVLKSNQVDIEDTIVSIDLTLLISFLIF